MTDAFNTSSYDYKLPEELIAQAPLPNRADARLMIVDRKSQTIDHAHFRDLPEYLRSEDSLVLNDTRVLPAKLLGRRLSTGGRWQGLYLESDADDNWKLLCKTRGKLFEGDRVVVVDRQGRDDVVLRLLVKLEGGAWVAAPETEEHSISVLQRVGRVPLPHYIRHGDAIPADVDDYQTVFAEHLGSVAAPTAGLHFTEPLLTQVEQLGTSIQKVTLHVGVGTFRPIQTDRIDEHQMHEEWCEVTEGTAKAIQATQSKGGRIIAVGTTSVRTLESAAAKSGTIDVWEDKTDLFIHPPYDFRVVDGLITNFHLPRSTLLVLVQTLGGRSLVQKAYAMAIEEAYRFYSYGDAMLII